MNEVLKAENLLDKIYNTVKATAPEKVKNITSLTVYKIYGNTDATKVALDEKGVSYINTPDPSVILVSADEKTYMRCLKTDVAEKSTHMAYLREGDTLEMANNALKMKENTSESPALVYISGISDEERKRLFYNCGKLSQGFAIGTSGKNGDVSFWAFPKTYPQVTKALVDAINRVASPITPPSDWEAAYKIKINRERAVSKISSMLISKMKEMAKTEINQISMIKEAAEDLVRQFHSDGREVPEELKNVYTRLSEGVGINVIEPQELINKLESPEVTAEKTNNIEEKQI